MNGLVGEVEPGQFSRDPGIVTGFTKVGTIETAVPGPLPDPADGGLPKVIGMMNAVLIAVGGGLGALLRFWVAGWAQRITSGNFPLGTLVVNVTGCVLIGVVGAMLASAQSVRPEVRPAIIIGLLGSFTTFSTFGGETMELLQQRQLLYAGLNVLLSNGLGLAGVWLGFRLVGPIG